MGFISIFEPVADYCSRNHHYNLPTPTDLVHVCGGLNKFKCGTNHKKVGLPITESSFSAN